jgi:hypothetical protein
MGRYNAEATNDVQFELVQASTVGELESQAGAALSAVPSGRAVTGLWLAGSGDGGEFTMTLEHAVAVGLDPANIDVLFYEAQTVAELTLQRNAAEGRATSGYELRDTETAGASKGLPVMGMLVFIDPVSGPSNPAIDQTTWWIDRQFGDNANDGLTEGTAIRDFAEFSRRVGENPLVTDTVTVNIVTLFNIGLTPPLESIVMEATFYGENAAVVFKGKITGAISSTVGTFVAMDQAAPNGTDGYFTDSGVFNFDGSVGSLFGFTIGGEVYYSFISASLATNTRGRINRPTRRTGLRETASAAPSPGDAWQQFPVGAQTGGAYVHAHRYEVDGPAGNLKGATFVFEHLEIIGFSGGASFNVICKSDGEITSDALGGGTDGPQPPTFYQCRFSSEPGVMDSAVTLIQCIASLSAPGDPTQRLRFDNSNVMLVSHCGSRVDFYDCRVWGIFSDVGSQCYFDGGADQAVRFYSGSVATDGITYGFNVFRDNREGVLVDIGCDVKFDTLAGNCGTGALGYALRVNGSAWYNWNIGVTATIAKGVGTPTDTIIGGTGVDYSGGATNLPYIEPANNAMLVVRP